MKKILYILIAVACLSLSSCNDWLDVNDNPNSGTEYGPSPDQRLPSILAQYMDAYESAGTRCALMGQQLSCVYALNNNWYFSAWRSTAGSAAWPWQAWYVNTAVNFDRLIESAEEVGAYHYIGAAKVIKASGFALMADLYGILPYQEAFSPTIAVPAFDDAQYIYENVIFQLLDEAIVEFNKTQTNSLAPTLKAGDPLNGGDVNKWIMLANGLKARHLNHLSKKASYDPQAIIAALDKAPKTVAQSSIYQYVDETPSASTAKEALQYTNTGFTVRFTKQYIDYLTNTYPTVSAAASGIEDPRVDIIIPSYQKKDGTMERSAGVDMASNLPNVGPSQYSYDKDLKEYVTSNTSRKGDTIYVQMRKSTATDGRIVSTGSWYTQRGGQCLFVTAAEMKFIEAEVKFRLNNADVEALNAYHDGIRLHMEMLGVASADAEAYIASPAVAKAGELTMSHIMIQKYIAMSFSPEIFSDLRRHNYCSNSSGQYDVAQGVYKGFVRPANLYSISYPNATDWPRRFAMASYEVNYNTNKLLEKDPDATKDTYLSKPVWWDQP